MMNTNSSALLFLFVPIFFATGAKAGDCPDLAGRFHAKIAATLVNLTITQKDCESYVFTYDYPHSTVAKTYLPNGSELLQMDDGDRAISETAVVKKLMVGEKYTVLALEITRKETSRLEERTLKAVSYFYEEKRPTSRAVVERRDWTDSTGDRVRRVYIGYAAQEPSNQVPAQP